MQRCPPISASRMNAGSSRATDGTGKAVQNSRGIGEVLDQARGDLRRQLLGRERQQRDDRLDAGPARVRAREIEEEAAALVPAALEQRGEASIGLIGRPALDRAVAAAPSQPPQRSEPVEEDAVHEHVFPVPAPPPEDQLGPVAKQLVQRLRSAGAAPQPRRRESGLGIPDRAEVEAGLELADDGDEAVADPGRGRSPDTRSDATPEPEAPRGTGRRPRARRPPRAPARRQAAGSTRSAPASPPGGAIPAPRGTASRSGRAAAASSS